MLLQSHAGEIQLLPALHSARPAGSVKGLSARRGFVVDMSSEKCELSSATIHSTSGQAVRVTYKNRTWKSKTRAVKSYILDYRLKLRKLNNFLAQHYMQTGWVREKTEPLPSPFRSEFLPSHQFSRDPLS